MLSQVMVRPILNTLQVPKLIALLFAYSLKTCILTDTNNIQEIICNVYRIQKEALKIYKSILT